MAVTQLAIANWALTKLGDDRVTNVSSPTTEAEIVINAIWDYLRQDELRKRVWHFSTIRKKEIDVDSTAPDYGFSYRYAVPTGFLRALQVGEDTVGVNLADVRGGDQAEYRIEGGFILCNTATHLNLRYTQDITDVTKWDPSFTNVFACRLAVELCERLTQNPEKRQLAQREYNQAVADAMRANAFECAPEVFNDSTWVVGRE